MRLSVICAENLIPAVSQLRFEPEYEGIKNFLGPRSRSSPPFSEVFINLQYPSLIADNSVEAGVKQNPRKFLSRCPYLHIGFI